MAILLVLFWHYIYCQAVVCPRSIFAQLCKVFPLAWSGVDLFFVLSGFLIGGILLDHKESPNYFKVFYLRRACRIFPLYFFCLIVFFILQAVLSKSVQTQLGWIFDHTLPAWTYFTFTQNFVMAKMGDFGNHFLGVTWSLAVEEQFYLVLPLLIRFISLRFLPVVFIFFIILAPLLRLLCLQFPGGEYAAYVLMPCRADSLFLGVLCAYCLRQEHIKIFLQKQVIYLYFLAAASGAGLWMMVLNNKYFLSPEMSLYGYSLTGIFFASLLVIAVLEKQGVMKMVTSWKWLMNLGLMAFGVYMFHQGISGFMHGLILKQFPKLCTNGEALVSLATLTVTLIAAYLSWRFFERPITRWGHKTEYVMPEQPSSRTFSNKHFLAVILIVACVFLAYGNSFKNGFMLDDYVFLFGKESLHNMSMKDVFTQNTNGFYRPVGFIILREVNFLFGNNPLGYQLATFTVFCLIGILFYILLFTITKNFPLALLSSSLYVAHPIHSVLVNYKYCVVNMAFIIGTQLSMLAFWWYREKGKPSWLFVSLIFYALALLSHEISFVLPVFLFLLSFLVRKDSFKQAAALCAPYLIVFVTFFIFRLSIVGSIQTPNPFQHLSVGQYLDLLSRLVSWYISKLFVPQDILFIWDEPLVDHVSFVGIGLFLISIIAVMIILFKKGRSLSAFAGWTLLMGIFPVLLIGFVHTARTFTAIMEPHWFGFSSIGFYLLVAQGIILIGKFVKPPVWKAGACIFVVLVCCITRESNAVWKTELSYCTYWAKHNKNNIAPLTRFKDVTVFDKGTDLNSYASCEEMALVGSKYYLAEDRKKAVVYHRLALEKNANCAPAYFFFGVYTWENGVYDKAAELFTKAHQLNPAYYPVAEEAASALKNMASGNINSQKKIMFLLFGL